MIKILHNVTHKMCTGTVKRHSRNPVWALETNLGRTDFSLFAIAAEANLYITDNKETGRQFLRNSLGLSPFGRQFIMQVLIEIDILPDVYAKLRALSTKKFSLTQNTLKNSARKPSTAVHLLFFISSKTWLSSSSFNSPSNEADSKWFNFLKLAFTIIDSKSSESGDTFFCAANSLL